MRLYASTSTVTLVTTMLGWPCAAHSQTPPNEPPPRLEATAQAAFLATTGNASTSTLGLGGEIIARPAPWMYRAKFAFAETSDHDELKARSTVALLRADRILAPRLSVFGQYDYLRDIFAAIEDRQTVQGGLAFRVVDTAPHRLVLDAGVGYEHEGRLNAADSNSAVAESGLAYRWAISPTSELVEEFRASLPFAYTARWKIDQSIALTAAINNLFSLKVSNTVRFVNEPVPGFESTDTISTVALVMKLRRPPAPSP